MTSTIFEFETRLKISGMHVLKLEHTKVLEDLYKRTITTLQTIPRPNT